MTSAFQLTYVPLCLTLFVVVTTGRAEIATAPVDGAINLAAPNVQKKRRAERELWTKSDPFKVHQDDPGRPGLYR